MYPEYMQVWLNVPLAMAELYRNLCLPASKSEYLEQIN
jgi:hypothetical protein